jgi:FkbM family methyltransferase
MHERAYGVYDTPKGRRVTMAYRVGTNDHNTLWASLNEDEYRLRDLSLTGTAVDVGGYLGSVGIGLAMDNPLLRVVIVEPVPPNCELIRENIARNELGDRVSLIEGAAGAGGEDVTVWYGYDGTEAALHHAYVGNSTLAYDDLGMRAGQSVTYQAVGLFDLIRDHGPLTLLKVDTEGAEWAFLDTPAIRDVDTIVGEVHPVRGHQPSDIKGLLGKTHEVQLIGPNQVTGPCGFEAVRR